MQLDKNHLPKHIGIIMDGNRRWAKNNGLKIIAGHKKVAREGTEKIVDHCIKMGIPFLTLWAWSCENWRREAHEVDAIMNLFRELFDFNSEQLHQKGVKIEVIGDVSVFPPDIKEKIAFWVNETRHNSNITVIMALNYGGRDEIIRALNKMLAQEQSIFEKKSQKTISQELFSQYLDTHSYPDPDLIIRPGGEKRLSGFFAWQSVYSELYFTDVLMPDFDEKQLDLALEDYAKRRRRYGK